jgi:hypothetical protein
LHPVEEVEEEEEEVELPPGERLKIVIVSSEVHPVNFIYWFCRENSAHSKS